MRVAGVNLRPITGRAMIPPSSPRGRVADVPTPKPSSHLPAGDGFSSMEMNLPTGLVKFFNTEKGWGFISPDGGGPDVFVHIKSAERSGVVGLFKACTLALRCSRTSDPARSRRRISGYSDPP
jgi:hypothetical protein